MKVSPATARAVLFLAAALASLSTWFYMNRILRAQQIADAAAHSRPRGNLSDLYPRWLGARELLRHGRNPYSAQITREIQQGYYGRTLDPGRPDDPQDQQGFAYPAYIVFLLAPTVDLPFDLVEKGFRFLLVGLAVATVLLWLYALRWKPSRGTALIFMVLMLGWLPMGQGIKLQQLSLLVAGLLAGCGACLAYIVFLLAPTVDLPFDLVEKGFRFLLVGLAVATVLLWLYALRWKPSRGTALIFMVLMLGWLPMGQGIKLQQLSLLVAGLLAGCGACLAGGWLLLAGGLLALATIKPQLTWPLVMWLLFWAGANGGRGEDLCSDLDGSCCFCWAERN